MSTNDETYAEYLARAEAEQHSGARKQMPTIEPIWTVLRDRELERESIISENRRMRAALDPNEPDDPTCH